MEMDSGMRLLLEVAFSVEQALTHTIAPRRRKSTNACLCVQDEALFWVVVLLFVPKSEI